MLQLLTYMVFIGEIHVYLNCMFGTPEPIHLEKPSVQEVFLPKLSQFSKGNNVIAALFLTQMVFFGDIHMFLQVR
jgi:hypothetical protein